MKFDDILIELGEFGTYQKRMYFLICLPAIPAAFIMLSTVFILATPNHRCAISDLSNDTYAVQGIAHEHLINQTIPMEKKDGAMKYSTCNVYNSSEMTQAHENSSQKGCESWVYDKSIFKTTVISDFDLVCSQKSFRTHSNMILMAGLLVGALGLGLLSDIIGRKKTFLLALVVQLGCGIGLSFSPNYIAFVVIRFFLGAATVGIYMCVFVVGMELVGPSKRTVAGIVIDFFWCLGLFILGAIAYGVRYWEHLQLIVACPLVLFFLYWWLIPESPRWLLAKGRYEEAATIIRKAAEVNKVDLPPKMLNLENLEYDQQEKVWKLFSSPVLIVRSLIIFFNWCVVSMMYYGLSLNVGQLGGDLYVNYLIGSVVETVGYVICLVFLDRTGRKKLHAFTMLLGGIACICTLFPVLYGDKSHEWATITLAMIGKLGISAAFGVIYVFSAELFPTVVRNSGMGLSSFFARIGGMVSPYVAEVGDLVEGDIKKALPLIVFGILAVTAGLLSLLLPETLNKKLPESVEDAEKFGRENKGNMYYPNTVQLSETPMAKGQETEKFKNLSL